MWTIFSQTISCFVGTLYSVYSSKKQQKPAGMCSLRSTILKLRAWHRHGRMWSAWEELSRKDVFFLNSTLVCNKIDLCAFTRTSTDMCFIIRVIMIPFCVYSFVRCCIDATSIQYRLRKNLSIEHRLKRHLRKIILSFNILFKHHFKQSKHSFNSLSKIVS